MSKKSKQKFVVILSHKGTIISARPYLHGKQGILRISVRSLERITRLFHKNFK